VAESGGITVPSIVRVPTLSAKNAGKGENRAARPARLWNQPGHDHVCPASQLTFCNTCIRLCAYIVLANRVRTGDPA